MPAGVYQHKIGRFCSKETRFKMSKIHKGKIISKIQRKEQSRFMKERFKIPEVREKAVLNLKISGPTHWNWKGGISLTKEYRAKQFLQSHRKRRNTKLLIGGFHSEKEWEDLKRKCHYKCLNCKKREPKIKLTRDHIIPICKKGSDDIKNIQPLCKSCNSKKHMKIIKYE